MKRIYIYLILLITVSSLIVPCSCLDTGSLPEGIGECLNNDEDFDKSFLENLYNSNYYILTTNPSINGYTLWFSSEPINFYCFKNFYNNYMYSIGTTSSEVNFYEITFFSEDIINFDYTTSSTSIVHEGGKSISRSPNYTSFIQGNYDIVDSESGEIYYTVPTVPTVLEVATKGVTLDGVLSEVVNLLPVVLIVVVGLIGIRKGIRFIKSNLIKS